MVENMQSRNFDEWHQFETFVKIYSKSNREHKLCVMGSLGPDFNTLNEPTKAELRKMTETVISWLTGLLKKGRDKGVFAFKGEPKDRALLVLSNMIASLQLARILGKTEFKSIQHSVLEDLKP